MDLFQARRYLLKSKSLFHGRVWNPLERFSSDLDLKLLDVGLKCTGLKIPGNRCAAQEQVMQAGIRPESIGIISPYGAQVKLIQRSLPYNAQMSVQVSTVDAFQGWVHGSLRGICHRYSERGCSIVRPRYLEKYRKMMINIDHLCSTFEFTVPDFEMPLSCSGTQPSNFMSPPF